MPTAPLETDDEQILKGDRWAFAQAEHLTALAGLFGEGAVLLSPLARGDDQR